MKKITVAAAAALCAAAASAAITSSNVVGYNTANVVGGTMNLLCVSWATPGNAEGKATLNDVIDTSKLVSYADDAGDYIDTWDMAAGNWGKRYYYVNQGDDLENWGAEYADTWMDGGFNVVDSSTVMVGAGSGFWYYANAPVTLTFTNPVK